VIFLLAATSQYASIIKQEKTLFKRNRVLCSFLTGLNAAQNEIRKNEFKTVVSGFGYFADAVKDAF